MDKRLEEIEVKKDMRNPLAKARDKWLDSYEGRQCQESGMVWGPYLKNRLELAFIAGWEAKEKHSVTGKKGRGKK